MRCCGHTPAGRNQRAQRIHVTAHLTVVHYTTIKAAELRTISAVPPVLQFAEFLDCARSQGYDL